MRMGKLAATVAALLLATGCGTTAQQRDDSADPQGAASMKEMSAGGMSMAGMAMGASDPSGKRPSSAALMVCSHETGSAVRRTFNLGDVPARRRMWMPPVFGCAWQLPHGTLQVAVDDANDPERGRQRFEQMRASIPNARELGGMESFGFPALQSRSGMVVFLKDGKVLSVDARHVARRDLPARFSREDVAYAVASAVIACWAE